LNQIVTDVKVIDGVNKQ